MGPSIWLPSAFLRITLYVISCAHQPNSHQRISNEGYC